MTDTGKKTRMILFTGKGGVGKTSIAASTAAQVARRGQRTLLVSSDLAHNLSDVFDVPLEHGEADIGENLRLLEVDVLAEIRQHWASMQAYLTDLLSYLGVDSVVAEEVALFPGMDEIFLLTRILREIEAGEYDLIVMDCAPTAGTLRLLTFTDSSSSKLNKLIDVERSILKLIRPVGRRFKNFKAIIPQDEIYETLGQIIADIGRLGDILRDPARASVRLVLNPDPIAVAETRRSYIYFALFGFPVDAVCVNKLLPSELERGWFEQHVRMQREQMAVIETAFLDTRILTVPLLDRSPVGEDALAELGVAMYGQDMPDAILSVARGVRFEREDEHIVLSFNFPTLSKSELDIAHKGGELILRAGPYSRVLQLPDSLHDASVAGAEFRHDQLQVRFLPRAS